ncbi:hypothetical protein QFZ23_002157 [Arthrobacter globiformis]|nr:hypothetical protein [Arthrobacter globiformis]
MSRPSARFRTEAWIAVQARADGIRDVVDGHMFGRDLVTRCAWSRELLTPATHKHNLRTVRVRTNSQVRDGWRKFHLNSRCT